MQKHVFALQFPDETHQNKVKIQREFTRAVSRNYLRYNIDIYYDVIYNCQYFGPPIMENNDDLPAAGAADDVSGVPNSAPPLLMDEVKDYVDRKNESMLAQIRDLFAQNLRAQSSQAGSGQGFEDGVEMASSARGNASQSNTLVHSASASQARDEVHARPVSPTVSIFAGKDYDEDTRSVISHTSRGSVELETTSTDNSGTCSDVNNDWKVLLETVSKELGCPVASAVHHEENKSYLQSGTKPEKKSMVELPLEGVCKDSFDKLAANGTSRIPMFKAQTEHDFRASEDDYKRYLRAPKLDKAAELRIRSDSHNTNGKFMYGNIDRRNDAEFYEIDKTARVGMTVTNHLSLLLAFLDRKLRSIEGMDESLLAIVGHAVNASVAGFDQHSRVACRAVVARRKIAISNMRLPDLKLKEDLLKLPLHGEDMFGGKFAELTRDHAQILQDMKATCDKESSFSKGTKRQAPKGFDNPGPRKFKQATASSDAPSTATPKNMGHSAAYNPNPKNTNSWNRNGKQNRNQPTSFGFRNKGKFFDRSKNSTGGRF